MAEASHVASLRYADAALASLTEGDSDRAVRKELSAARDQLLSSRDDPVVALARSAGCPDDEVEALALLVSVERSLARQRKVAGLAGDGLGSVRLGLLDALRDDNHRGAGTVGPGSRLRRAHLVTVEATGPFAARSVSVQSTVLWALTGDSLPDPDLPVRSVLIERPQPNDGSTSLLVVGDDATRRRTTLLGELASQSVLIVPEPDEVSGWSAAIREATLANSALVIELKDTLSPTASRILEDASHLVLGLSSSAEVDADILPPRSWKELRAPEAAASSAEVKRLLGTDVVHSLTADQLRRVHVTMPLVDGDVDRAVRRLTDNRLFRLGTRTPARRGWDSLIVDDNCMLELRDLTHRYRYKSAMRELPNVGRFVAPGVLAVFAGPSGTGKTLAAEVISHELGLELVKIDLSTVVSKYIGETEKNLDEVFDAAAMGGALVLFDEGDALFGKRSEVSEAKDRYANIEVAYLLQRVETFEGFVIISTNLAGNIDTAFQRRLHGMVTFANPERSARTRLWDLHLPPELCAPEVDREKLANLSLAGGGIRNAAVAAAFLAAADATPIGREHLRVAIKRELQKLNRLSDGIDL
jgi:hypothetical protein